MVVFLVTYKTEHKNDDQVDAGCRRRGDEAGAWLNDTFLVGVEDSDDDNTIQDDSEHGC